MGQVHTSSDKAVGLLCSLGLFIAGYIFYSSSLTQTFYAAEFSLTSWQIGIAQSAVPLGAILGAILAGRLADMVGRHRLLVINFIMLTVIGLVSALAYDFYSLCFFRMISGFLAGTLYPLCAAYLTEMTPEASLARQSAVLMFINCLAAPVACVIAMILSLELSDHTLWRVIMACYAIPSFAAFIWSKRFSESKEWLRCEEKNSHSTTEGIANLFKQPYGKITCCLIGAWFLMDVAYYGINFFVPYLLQIMEVKSISSSFSNHSLLSSEAVWGTFVINIFFMLGALAAIYVVEKVNLFKLQKYGFLYSSISLFLLAAYFYAGLHQSYIIILLFIIFNFAINLGPDVTTYLLSATSYPVEIRGSGHGLIAGSAKFGSFLGVLFLPRIQDIWGYQIVILLLAILLFAAYVLTISLAKALSSDTNRIELKDIAYENN